MPCGHPAGFQHNANGAAMGKQVTPPRLHGEWGYDDGSGNPTRWGYRAATLMHLDTGETPEQALRRSY